MRKYRAILEIRYEKAVFLLRGHVQLFPLGNICKQS